MTVKGIVDAHPMHREIALLTELLMTKCLLGEVTEFDIERLVAHLLGDGLDHLTEEVLLAPFTLSVFTFTHHPTVHEEIRGEDRGTVTDDGE